jgi:hypothetical protein
VAELERPGLAPLRDRGRRRRRLVQRIEQRPDALVRFDPKTERFQRWAIPSGVGIIRHMRETPDGNLVIHQSSTNTIGLVTMAKPQS